MTGRPLRIALLAASRYPVRQPFAGGLEAFVFEFAHALTTRGHRVTMFAAPGSVTDLPWEVLPLHTFRMSEESRSDPSAPDWVVHETHAYLSVMLQLAGALGDSFDVVHNHSLHYLPLAMAHTIAPPMLTTLHTPPLKWLEQAVALPGGVASEFVAVSAYTASQWQPINGQVAVIRNGVNLRQWQPGPGGEDAVWTGRLVPEKGVTAAISAARLAGFALRIAGPIGNNEYFDEQVRPLLGGSITYEGHLCRDDINALVGTSAVALVTPDWEEPYGLVVAEALASGTPVAAFRRGGIPEILNAQCGRLARSGDIEGLSRAMCEAAELSRADVRSHAEDYCSQDAMVEQYLDRYAELIYGETQEVSA